MNADEARKLYKDAVSLDGLKDLLAPVYSRIRKAAVEGRKTVRFSFKDLHGELDKMDAAIRALALQGYSCVHKVYDDPREYDDYWEISGWA
jgi:hypothetical protein